MTQKVILVYISHSMDHLLRQDFIKTVDHQVWK